MTAMQTFKTLPGVLAFQRGLVMSDALFYSKTPDGSDFPPVLVERHGIRGTQNINETGESGGSSRGAPRQEVSNLQETDTAKLSAEAIGLIARFGIGFLDLRDALSSCAAGKEQKGADGKAELAALRDSIAGFITRAKESEGLRDVARRYARNILNGRWLWRNRTLATAATVTVTARDGAQTIARADALALPLNRFDAYTEAEQALGDAIARSLAGAEQIRLEVEADVDFGVRGRVEVFPSQNYIDGKPKGFARSLYCVGHPRKAGATEGRRIMGQAALRDQKVANAIRTIDTWYPAYAETGRPIPVEPNGANLDAQSFFRDGKDNSAFSLVARLNTIDPNSPEGMFVIACLVRGGVYSGKKGE